jgi:hypothetical protein
LISLRTRETAEPEKTFEQDTQQYTEMAWDLINSDPGLQVRVLRFDFLQDGDVGATNWSWGLPVKGGNFVCPCVAQQERGIITS